MPKLIRITTAPLSLKYLLAGQMRYMQEHGMDVIMVSSDGPELEEVKAREGCPHHMVPMTRSITPVTDLKTLWQMYRFFKRERPDIVHAHTPKAGLIAMLAARMAGVKHRVHTIAGLRFMTATGLQRKLLICMERLTAAAATHVWPNSKSLLDYLTRHRLVDSRKLEVIGRGSSNGINLHRFSPQALSQEKLTQVKQQIGYDPALNYIVCIGRIVKDKGIEELATAFTRIGKEHPELRLVLVGSFEDDLDPISVAAKQTLQSHPQIILTGWSDAVEYYLSFAHLLVHPSHREGFPNVLMQAGAMNCPVICSRIEGNIDIIQDRETGMLFPVNDANGLEDALRWAVLHPVAMQTYAQANNAQITQYFEQSAVHRLILERYRQLTG